MSARNKGKPQLDIQSRLLLVQGPPKCRLVSGFNIQPSRIAAEKVSPDYGVEEECILKGDGEMGGAYIVRLPAGDSNIYLRRAVDTATRGPR